MITLLLIVVTLAGYSLNEAQLSATAARRDADNLARGFAENVSSTINGVDQILLLMRAAYAADPSRIRLADWAPPHLFNNSLTLQIGVIDRRGRLIDSNLGMPKQVVDLSDRAHFRAQLDPAKDQLFVSDPILGRVTGRRTIQLSRKLFTAAGQFDGVLVVSLDTEDLSSYYQSFDINDGEILLFSTEGVVAARGAAANPTSGIGMSLRNTTLSTLLDHQGPGQVEAQSIFDHTSRVYAYRPLPDHPLTVAAGLSMGDINQPLWHRIRLAAFVSALMAIGVLIMGRALWLRQNKEYEAQAILAQSVKLAQLGEVATGIAHELRQPLAAISMSAQNCIASIDRGRSTPDSIRAKLDRIIGIAERTSQMIGHMQVFGRTDPGTLSAIALQQVIDNTLGLIQSKLQSCNVTIVVDLPPDLPDLRGHLVLLEQVMMNLIGNACDAYGTPGDAGDGVCRTIAITARTLGGEMEIVVQDQAGGIPDFALDRLFVPFFTTKSVGQGTGLGLSISYGIITDLGGTILAANRDGGARFTIRLPLA